MSRQTTLAVLGLFGSPNLGNEATLGSFVHNVSLRLPGARFVCIAPRQSNAESEYGFRLIDLAPRPVGQHLWRVRPPAVRTVCTDVLSLATEGSRRRMAEKALDGVDALTMPGTGIIDDFGQRPLDMPMHLDRWTAAAARRAIPVSYVSVGVSTISRASSRWLFGRSLARAAYRSFRDQVSATNAAKLGLRGNEAVFPDLAFGLPDHVLQASPQASRDRPVVGLGVMGYFGWNRSAEQGARIYSAYLGKTLALVSTLVADGCDVRFLIGDLRADRRTVDELMQACLAAGIPAARLAAPQIDNYEDVVRELAQVDLVVAARFHNVLLGLALQTPVISIGYSDKNDAVMAQFGLQSYCHDIERFDVGSVLQQARSLLDRPNDVVAHLPQALADARRRLELQFDDLCERWSAA